MKRSLVVAAIGLMCATALALSGIGQQTASDSVALQNLLVNQKEVQDALGSDWTLKAKVEVTAVPPNSIAAALIYGNTQTSMLTVLYQFDQESQGHDFFTNPPFINPDNVLSRDKPDALNEAFKGAAEVSLTKVRTGERDAPSEDGQQLVLLFRVGRIVASFSIQLCIPAHADPSSGTPIDYQCFNESQLRDGLTKAGQKQVAILYTGR
jgi:hypothetical protein